MDLGEHVERVADEHREQSGDEEAVRRAPLAARGEGDLQRHDEQEERGRRVENEDQLQVHRRAPARQHGLDHVHERAGEHGERRDDGVVDDAEAVARRPGAGPDDDDERRAQDRVARQHDEIRDERAVRREDTERVQVVAGDAAGYKEHEGGERHEPRQAFRRVVAVDAERDRPDRAGSRQTEGHSLGRIDEGEGDEDHPDARHDEAAARDDEDPEALRGGIGLRRVLPPGQDRHTYHLLALSPA